MELEVQYIKMMSKRLIPYNNGMQWPRKDRVSYQPHGPGGEIGVSIGTPQRHANMNTIEPVKPRPQSQR